MDTAILIGMELIKVNAADYLLLGLVGLFFFSGLGYKIKASGEVSKLRKTVEEAKAALAELNDKEHSLRDEVKSLLTAQSVNTAEMNRLKTMKSNLGKLPVTLGKDLEDLVAWCHQKKVSVNFERRMAAKRQTPKGRQM